jgi:hypothetical protein
MVGQSTIGAAFADGTTASGTMVDSMPHAERRVPPADDHNKLRAESSRPLALLHRARRKPFGRKMLLLNQASQTGVPMSMLPRTTTLAAVLLLAAAPLAFNPVAPTGAWAQAPVERTAPVAAPRVNLSLEQRNTIRELVKELNVTSAAPEAPMTIGDTVPKDIELHPMPTRVGEKVSQVKNHLFFRKGAELAIVDPKDDKIVDVIK